MRREYRQGSAWGLKTTPYSIGGWGGLSRRQQASISRTVQRALWLRLRKVAFASRYTSGRFGESSRAQSEWAEVLADSILA